MNFMDKGRDVLQKLARDETLINHNNLIFKTGDPIIKNIDFPKIYGTLHYLIFGLKNTKTQKRKF